MGKPVIELSSATLCSQNRRGYKVILRNVNLQVFPYEMVYLIGKVGSGKSTLLKTLYGELPLAAGQGMIVGEDLNTLKSKRIPFLRRKLGMVFQDFQLLDDRNVYENLHFVLQATGWKNKAAMHDRILEILQLVGLEHKIRTFPYKLSGGEQQRLAIGRALLNHPLVILADEPTGNLDPESYERVMNLFTDIAATGCGVLIATHNISVIERFPARTIRCANRTTEEIDIVSILGLENETDRFSEQTFGDMDSISENPENAWESGPIFLDESGHYENDPSFERDPHGKGWW